VAYIFEYKGRKVVISGDTVPSERVQTASKGADILIHEALSPELVKMMHNSAVKAERPNLATILNDIPNYHTSPEQAAAIAQKAGVKMLLLHHIVPPLRLKALEGPFLGKARQIFDGRLIIGTDGDFFTLPADKTTIKKSSRL